MGKKKRADLYVNVDNPSKEVDDLFVEVMGHDVNNLNQVILANLELFTGVQQLRGRAGHAARQRHHSRTSNS